MMRIAVVLPAPFAPTKPVIRPRSTVKLTPDSARVAPKDLVTSSSSSMRPASSPGSLTGATVPVAAKCARATGRMP